MNCFQHPNSVALVYCKECNQPLCLDCARQDIMGQTHVCSEVCAKLVSLRPPEEKEDSLFNRVYASIFIVLLLGLLGGIFVAWGGQSAMHTQKRRERGEYVSRRDRPNDLIYLYYLGITDWRLQFALGAAIGAGSGLFYVRKNIGWKKA
jgi:hypothetical protein